MNTDIKEMYKYKTGRRQAVYSNKSVQLVICVHLIINNNKVRMCAN